MNNQYNEQILNAIEKRDVNKLFELLAKHKWNEVEQKALKEVQEEFGMVPPKDDSDHYHVHAIRNNYMSTFPTTSVEIEEKNNSPTKNFKRVVGSIISYEPVKTFPNTKINTSVFSELNGQYEIVIYEGSPVFVYSPFSVWRPIFGEVELSKEIVGGEFNFYLDIFNDEDLSKITSGTIGNDCFYWHFPKQISSGDGNSWDTICTFPYSDPDIWFFDRLESINAGKSNYDRFQPNNKKLGGPQETMKALEEIKEECEKITDRQFWKIFKLKSFS